MKPRKKKVLPAVANFYCPAPKKEAKAQDRQRSLTLPMAVLCFFATFSVALPTHPLAGAATVCCFGLSSSFVDSILSTRFCRLWFVDSILSTRFCRLDSVDSILSTDSKFSVVPFVCSRQSYRNAETSRPTQLRSLEIFSQIMLRCSSHNSRKNVRGLINCRLLASKVHVSCYHRALLSSCIEYAIRRHISKPPNTDTTQKKRPRRIKKNNQKRHIKNKCVSLHHHCDN